MKDLTEIEAFEIIARRVNKLFDEAGDEIETALAKLNNVDSVEDLDDTEMLDAVNFTNAIVMSCNIHEMFWSGLLHLYPDTFKVLNNKAKQGEMK
jgi:hypothetical protein